MSLNSAIEIENNVCRGHCGHGENRLPPWTLPEGQIRISVGYTAAATDSRYACFHPTVLWGVCVKSLFITRHSHFPFLMQTALNAKVKAGCCRNPCQICKWFLCTSGATLPIKTFFFFPMVFRNDPSLLKTSWNYQQAYATA